ncbi:NUDIX domain-containing protein [Coniochaeta sp. 2T2.1]|nr:NUDIX domain-containing protein [Coniochaeta sp. 2T2.1]
MARRFSLCPAMLRLDSILLLSPTNKVLLLHRVRTSTSFPSAHVFPGGNLSTFHEGPIPDVHSAGRHTDGEAYRLAAVRETFEESGILLARRQNDGRVLNVPSDILEDGRKKTHGEKVKFGDWVASLGGKPDVDNILPFTRWVTPTNVPKRFTTQMYLYMIPLPDSTSDSGILDASSPKQAVIVQTPTHDGGLEHTAAKFDSVSAWLDKARDGSIILFPPQLYLLTLLSEFLTGDPPRSSSKDDKVKHYARQRSAVTAFLSQVPTTPAGMQVAKEHPAAVVPWAEKVISPTALFTLPGDGRLVLGLDKPGPELVQSGRAGDPDRVVLVDFKKEGPRRVEVRTREEVLRQKREAEAVEETKSKL